VWVCTFSWQCANVHHKLQNESKEMWDLRDHVSWMYIVAHIEQLHAVTIKKSQSTDDQERLSGEESRAGLLL